MNNKILNYFTLQVRVPKILVALAVLLFSYSSQATTTLADETVQIPLTAPLQILTETLN